MSDNTEISKPELPGTPSRRLQRRFINSFMMPKRPAAVDAATERQNSNDRTDPIDIEPSLLPNLIKIRHAEDLTQEEIAKF